MSTINKIDQCNQMIDDYWKEANALTREAAKEMTIEQLIHARKALGQKVADLGKRILKDFMPVETLGVNGFAGLLREDLTGYSGMSKRATELSSFVAALKREVLVSTESTPVTHEEVSSKTMKATETVPSSATQVHRQGVKRKRDQIERKEAKT